MGKTILITGASSGIGKAVAIHFQEKGWNVIATMRSPEKETELVKLSNVFVTKLDVQDTNSITNAISAGIKKFGNIDLLVNNAGYGQYGVFEATSQEKIQKQFDVNVFGVMNVTRAILPHFRERKNGMILNVSSGAGKFTLPMLSMYHASKFALEGFSEALSYELIPQGITVKIVEPGGVTTKFHETSTLEFAADPALTDYNPFIESTLKLYDGMLAAKLSTSEEVATGIYEAATDGTDTLRYVVGEDIKPLIQMRTSLPEQEYVNFMRSQFK
jgi:short-subunit dehydrogenase